MNTNLRKKAHNFENFYFKLMNNVGAGKIMENMRKNIEILTCHNRKKKKMFDARTKLSYCKVFHRKLITNRNEKNRDTRIK